MVKSVFVEPDFIKKALCMILKNDGPISMTNIKKSLSKSYPELTEKEIESKIRYARELWCKGLVNDKGEPKK